MNVCENDLEQKWECFKKCLVAAAGEVCGTANVGRQKGTAWCN